MIGAANNQTKNMQSFIKRNKVTTKSTHKSLVKKRKNNHATFLLVDFGMRMLQVITARKNHPEAFLVSVLWIVSEHWRVSIKRITIRWRLMRRRIIIVHVSKIRWRWQPPSRISCIRIIVPYPVSE